MDIKELRNINTKLYNKIQDADLKDEKTLRNILFELSAYNAYMLNELMIRDATGTIPMISIFKDRPKFIEGINKLRNNKEKVLNIDILKWYVDLYHSEPFNTECGIMAAVIARILMDAKNKNFEFTSEFELFN